MAPKYRPGALDADGRYYLTAAAGSVIGSKLYDVSLGKWGNPTSSLFSGGARDGYWYRDGVRTAWGDFGTIAGGVRHNSWATIDMAERMKAIPNLINAYYAMAYDPLRNDVSIVAEGRARMSSPSQGTFKTTQALSTAFHGQLQGDFDVELSILNLTGASYYIYVPIHLIVFGGQGQVISVHCERLSSGNCNFSWHRGDDRSDASTSIAAGVSVGANPKLKITRVGNLYTVYYDRGQGAGWVSGGTYTSSKRLRKSCLYVGALLSQYDGSYPSGANCAPSVDVEITLNSGTYVTRPTWALRAASVDRGSRADFPEKALLVWTQKELVIIDTETEKLWMRFKNSQIGTHTDYILPGVSATTVIANAGLDVDTGAIYAQLYDGTTASKGSLVMIDFASDGVNVFHNSASNVPIGGSFDISYNANYPWWQFTHALDYPNGGDPDTNWSKWTTGGTPRSNWTVQSDLNRAIATWSDATYGYKAIATAIGVQVVRRLPGMMDPTPDNTWNYATAITVTDARAVSFTSDGDLVYADAAFTYIVLLATWQAAFGGTFADDVAVAQPGTVSHACQYSITSYTDGLLVARDEGVYRISIPGGVSTLLISSPGGGATYEVLPSFTELRAVSAVQFGTVDVALIATTEAGPLYFVHAIRLDTGNLAGSGEATDLGADALSVHGVV